MLLTEQPVANIRCFQGEQRLFLYKIDGRLFPQIKKAFSFESAIRLHLFVKVV